VCSSADGVLLLHTITGPSRKQLDDEGLPISIELIRFVKFMVTEIFPGGRLPSIDMVEEHSAAMGFTLTRRQSLQQHHARTLDLWWDALQARKADAIELQSQEVFERYMKYLTGCAGLFRSGYIDVNQFTLQK
jgi:cyclopropane-fatty-acyl-phospholipid synthase